MTNNYMKPTQEDDDFMASIRPDTKKRTADRRSTRPQHELHDSPWVWLAGPVLLLGVLALGYVRMIVGV